MRRATKRLVIGRIELDLRNAAFGTAEAMAHALGPAIARALAERTLRAEPTERIDAGHVAAPTGNAELADGIAQRIAHHLSTKDS